jgi:hypothetical protein
MKYKDRPISKNIVTVPFVMDGDKKASGPPIDEPKFLTG